MDRLRCTSMLLSAWGLCLLAGTARAQPDLAAWDYRIQPGDTLIGLAETYLDARHGWRDLQRLNRVADPLRLPPGGRLRLPIAWLQRESSVARVVFVQGQAQLLRDGQPAQALAVGALLRSGDRLRTGTQSSLSLRFVDGSRLLLEPDSELGVEQLLVYGRSAIPAMQLRLQQGGAANQVQPDAAQPPRYELRTPLLNLGVRGTEFRVQATPEATRVQVLEGRVAAGDAARATALQAGQGALARAGAALTLQALLPPPDLAGLPARLERLPLQFDWPALPGAVAYRAQVFAEGRFDALLLDGRFERPQAGWPDLPDGRYSLRLRGIDALGLEGRAAEAQLTVKARPEPPFVRAPAPAARLYGERVELAWTRAQDALRYRLQLAATADFAAPLLDRADLDANTQDLPLPPGRYHWRVASIAAGENQGPFGPAQAFELHAEPPSPALQPPELGDALLLRWQAGPPGTRYQLQGSPDPQFQRELQTLELGEAQASLPRPPPGRYYLRLRAIDALGHAGPYGGTQQVDVPHPRWLWLLTLLPLLGL